MAVIRQAVVRPTGHTAAIASSGYASADGCAALEAQRGVPMPVEQFVASVRRSPQQPLLVREMGYLFQEVLKPDRSNRGLLAERDAISGVRSSSRARRGRRRNIVTAVWKIAAEGPATTRQRRRGMRWQSGRAASICAAGRCAAWSDGYWPHARRRDEESGHAPLVRGLRRAALGQMLAFARARRRVPAAADPVLGHRA